MGGFILGNKSSLLVFALPVGIPTLVKLQALITFIGGYAVGGGVLKEIGVIHWNAPNTGAVDTYAFTMLPGGNHSTAFGYDELGTNGYLWSKTQNAINPNYAWGLKFFHDDAIIEEVGMSLKSSRSVRLLKNFSYALPSFGVMTDYDGNIYTYITIGTQQWMIQNLRTTHYGDGTVIPNLILNAVWAADLTGAYCWYNNDAVTYADYGPLYNWYAVDNAHGLPYFKRNGVFEAGWRIPANADWITLIDTILGGTLIAGGKLKETGVSHWTAPNTGATNETGFTALAAGARGPAGGFAQLGLYNFLWQSTAFDLTKAYYAAMINNSTVASYNGNDDKNNGMVVRCMRDLP
jgi:uncharacterized protein (TIGR02145 family)